MSAFFSSLWPISSVGDRLALRWQAAAQKLPFYDEQPGSVAVLDLRPGFFDFPLNLPCSMRGALANRQQSPEGRATEWLVSCVNCLPTSCSTRNCPYSIVSARQAKAIPQPCGLAQGGQAYRVTSP